MEPRTASVSRWHLSRPLEGGKPQGGRGELCRRGKASKNFQKGPESRVGLAWWRPVWPELWTEGRGGRGKVSIQGQGLITKRPV